LTLEPNKAKRTRAWRGNPQEAKPRTKGGPQIASAPHGGKANAIHDEQRQSLLHSVRGSIKKKRSNRTHTAKRGRKIAQTEEAILPWDYASRTIENSTATGCLAHRVRGGGDMKKPTTRRREWEESEGRREPGWVRDFAKKPVKNASRRPEPDTSVTLGRLEKKRVSSRHDSW